MKVLISGYYGAGNAGDEAVLAGLLRLLAEGGEGRLRPVVLSADPERTRREHGVEARPRLAAGPLIRELRSSLALISGGGGLLQDVTSLRSCFYYWGVIRLAQALGTPVFAHAQGLGPLRRRLSQKAAAAALRRARRVSVRDEDSARLAVSLGLPARSVHLGADLAWLAPEPGDRFSSEEEALEAMPGEPGRTLGLILRWPPERSRREEAAARLKDWASSAAAWAEGRGAVCCIGLFHPEEDTGIEAAAGSSAPAIRLRSWRAARRFVERCRAVVSMRFHGVLLAAAAGRPAAAVAVDGKVASLARALGISCLPVEAPAGEDFDAALDGLWEAPGAERTAEELERARSDGQALVNELLALADAGAGKL